MFITKRIPAAGSAIFLIACACASGRIGVSGGGDGFVMVNGEKASTDGARSLLDLLLGKVPSSMVDPTVSDRRPLVLLDGAAAVDGNRVLVETPVGDVASVTILRPVDAMARYGSRAVDGAIVIQTRGNRGTGRLLRPSATESDR